MVKNRQNRMAGTLVNHDGPNSRGHRNGYGRAYTHIQTGDIAAALGCQPTSKDKVYLTVHEIVSFGIVERAKGQPKVTVEDVVRAVNDLGLDHHAIRDGQLVFDPIPIRVYLTVPPVPMAEVVRSYSDMRQHIASIMRGRVKPGDPEPLPTQKVLAREFGVTSHTIADAMVILRDEGLIYSVHGKGTFAAPRKDS